MDILVDASGFTVIDPVDMSSVGLPLQSYYRTVMALASNEYETGPVAIFGGEYIIGSDDDFITDTEGFVLGFPPVMVDRLVWAITE